MTTSVLLVEDNPGDAGLVQHALGHSAIDVDLTHVSTIADAIGAIDQEMPDCILLDLGLDDADGLDGLTRLRSIVEAPIIILTSVPSFDVISEAIEEGADDYLVKNELHEHTLEKTVHYALERQAFRDALREQERRFRSLVEHAFDGVVVLSRNGGVRYASPVAEGIMGGLDEAGHASIAERIHPDDYDAVAAAFEAVASEADAEAAIELRVQHTNGSYRWLNARCRNRLEDPAVKGIVVNFNDDTDRKEQQEATRQAQGRLRTLLHDVPAVIYTAEGGPKGRWYYVSPQIEATLGFTPQEWLADPDLWSRQIYADDAARVHAAEAASEEAVPGHPVVDEYRMVHRDGHVVWVRDVARVMSDDRSPGKRLFQGVLLDITHEKEIEAELRESHATYRALLQNSSDMVSLVDPDLSMVYASPSIVRVSGFPADHFLGRAFVDGLHPDDIEPVQTKLREVLATEEGPVQLVYRRRRADGEMRWIDAIADCYRRDGRVMGLVINSRDVTEAHEAEDERRESQELTHATMELFRGAFRAAQTGIALIDASDNSYVDVNEALCEMLGYKKHELLELDWVSITHPDDLAKSRVEVRDFIEGRREVNLVHKRYLRKDGGVIAVEISDALVHASDGTPRFFVTHVTDVTEREAAATALKESQELLQAVINNSPALIYIKDRDGRYLLANERIAEHRGLGAQEVIGKSVHEVFSEETAREIAYNDSLVFGSMSPIEVEETVEHSDGELHTYLSVKFPLLDRDGECYALCGISTDITERVKAEEERARLEGQLRQSQKLEAIGQLAGGIAHDFNNVLAVVLNYAHFLSEDIGSDSKYQADIDEVVRAAQLGAVLTRQLLTFSRSEVTQPILLDCNEIITGMERLLSRLIRESIELQTSFDEDLWEVVADAGQVEQILMNLSLNARDAMPTGGRLSIATRNIHIGADFAAARPDLQVGDYVCIEVRDTGCGMDEETLARIFEPFFTTKPKDRGTGLGLATVYGIVKQSGGHIECRTEAGKGTTFEVYLPRSTAARFPELREAEADMVGPSKPGTILLVEDDHGVRNITARILKRAGHTVLTADSGPAALRILADHQAIDVLVTDMVMPGGMSGKDVSRLVGLPTIYLSGYTDNIIRDSGGLGDDEVLLQKPFTAASLVAATRDALQGNSGRARRTG